MSIKIEYKNDVYAAILVQTGRPLQLDRICLPDSLGYGQVLVRVNVSGLCGSQIGEIDAVKGPDNYLPHLLGHEGAGTVLQTGTGVSTVKAGDHVVLHWRPGKGIESPPPVYAWQDRKLNAGYVTTFNEVAVVSENRLTRIDDDVDLDIAALLGCAVTTGLGVVTRDAQLTIGESVIIIGAGGVGLSVIQGASMVSAYPIIAVDIADRKLTLARSFGATHTINSLEEDIETGVSRILGKHGADVVVEMTGRADLIASAYNLTQPQGRTIMVGVAKRGSNISIHSLPMHFGKTLKGSHGGGCRPEIDIPKYLTLYKQGKLKLDQLITDRYPLGEINHVIEKMRKSQIDGRCLLTIANDGNAQHEKI